MSNSIPDISSREKLAIAIAVVSFIVLFSGMFLLASVVGIPDYMLDGDIGFLGSCVLGFCMMISWRLYHIVISSSFHTDITPVQRIKWNYWFLGLAAYFGCIVVIWQLETPDLVKRIGGLVSGIGIFSFLGVRCYTAITRERYRDNQVNEQ